MFFGQGLNQRKYEKGADMNRAAVTIFVLWVLPLASIFPQETSGMSNFYDNPELKLDLPIFDLPYQIEAANIPGYNFFDSYTHPSMDLSLNITAGSVSALHYGMNKFKDAVGGTDKHWKRVVYYGGTAVGDLFLYFLPAPPSQPWMHEAFHSAAFTYGGVANHIAYDFPSGAYTAPDSGNFTRWYDWTRTVAAGLESQHLLIEKLQMNNFFYGQNMFNEFYYWWTLYNTWAYAYLPFISGQVTMTVEGEEQELATDSLLWAYFLFHPEQMDLGASDEEAEITLSSLNDSEKEFLKTRTMLSLLNFASPMMFGIKSIPLGKDTGLYGNFSLRHFYTSFGTDTSADIYLKSAPYNFKFVLHSYINYEHYFPAVEAVLVDFPLRLGSLGMYLSPRILIGAQPKDQGFFTSDPEFFGLIGLRADFALTRHFLPYIEFTAKTDGWVAGNEFLEAAAGVKLGISARF
jgi:hypothetical protein